VSSQRALLAGVRNALWGTAMRNQSMKRNPKDTPVGPELIGLTVLVSVGKGVKPVEVRPEMVGHKLGGFI